MTITITAFERSPDRGKGVARDMRVRWAFEEVGQPYDVRLLSFRAMKEPAHLALHPFGPSADLAGQSNSLAHEDKTPLLRVAQWVACAPCGLERMG